VYTFSVLYSPKENFVSFSLTYPRVTSSPALVFLKPHLALLDQTTNETLIEKHHCV
jgi:hypothetical protein